MPIVEVRAQVLWQCLTVLSEARGLTDDELAAIDELERSVVSSDGGRLKLEWQTLRHRPGDRVDDLLWWEDGRLVGFVGLYSFGGSLELAGMVHPGARRRGLGSALLGAALRTAADRHVDRALLVVPRSTPAGREFAVAHGGTLDHSEHFLALGATPSTEDVRGDVTLRPVTPDDGEALRRIYSGAFGGGGPGYVSTVASDRQLVIEQAGAAVGMVRITTHDSTTGIYGFAVEPALQGRGIGRAVLTMLCAQVRREGSREVTLEVAVDNDRALGLYTAVGFEPRATEDYYGLATT
jgi:ribosomal protein S18 acetylase RimI-like enzyme